MNCLNHINSVAVAACAHCGVGLCKPCVNSSEYTINNKPLCRDCNYKMITGLISTAKRSRFWTVVKLMLNGLFLAIGASIYFSTGDVMNALIYMSFGGIPTAWKIFSPSPVDEIRNQIYDSAEDIRDGAGSSIGNGVIRFVIRCIFAIFVGAIAAPILFLANIFKFFKHSSIIRENRALMANYVADPVAFDKTVSQPSSISGQASYPSAIAPDVEAQYAPKPVVPETKVHITPPPVSMPQEQAAIPQPAIVPPPVSPAFAGKKTQPLILWVGIAMLTVAAGFALYYTVMEPWLDGKNAVRMYTFSNLNTNLRTSPPVGPITEKLPYGTPLLVYNQDKNRVPDWSKVKHNKTDGYVASKYLLDEDEFLLLHSIFGDTYAQECLDESRYRRALLSYFKNNRLYGHSTGLPSESPYSGFQTGWQVYALKKGTRPNTMLFVGNKKYQDMGVIIRNENTGQRKCLLFAFDEFTEQPTLIHEENAPATGYLREIRSEYINGGQSFKVAYN